MKWIGLLVFAVGAVCVISALSMDTSVETIAGRVHNLGLMEKRQGTLIVGAVLMIIATLAVGLSSIVQALRPKPPEDDGEDDADSEREQRRLERVAMHEEERREREMSAAAERKVRAELFRQPPRR